MDLLLQEHSSTPGTFYENRLICDGGYGILNEMVINDLKEAVDDLKHTSKLDPKFEGKLLKFRGKFQEADSINKNQRMYPFDVLNKNVKRLEEAIKGGGLIGECDHPCLSQKDFEVLTPNGWKWFDSVRENDTVFSRVNGKMVHSSVKRTIDEPYDGKVYRIKGNQIDCTFTGPHKFLLCKRTDSHKHSSEEYYARLNEIHLNREKYGHDYIPKTAQWEGNDKETFVIPGVKREKIHRASQPLEINTTKFVEFIGLFLSEGYLVKNYKSNRIIITQKTEYGKKLIKNILSNFHSDIRWKEFKTGFAIHDARLYDYLKPLGNCYNKYVPKEIKQLSPRYLKQLIAAFAIGDGRMLDLSDRSKAINVKESIENIDNFELKANQRIDVFSVSKQLIDDIHECVVKAGWSGTVSVFESKEDYIFAGREIKISNKKPLHCLHISRNKGIYLDPRFLKTIEGHHTGRIYCLETEYGNFFMRYKGKAFWTGNSDSIIHFANCSHKITKLWWEGKTLMGEGLILDTPMGKLLRALINCGVRIGISSRGVGNGKVNEDGILVIGESYKLITFDAVADPSTTSAFQEKVEHIIQQNNSNSSAKNENSSIHNISDKLVMAVLKEMFKNNTSKIKARLK